MRAFTLKPDDLSYEGERGYECDAAGNPEQRWSRARIDDTTSEHQDREQRATNRESQRTNQRQA
jgi:hypothetical protein